jgi:chromosome segregation ATPase
MQSMVAGVLAEMFAIRPYPYPLDMTTWLPVLSDAATSIFGLLGISAPPFDRMFIKKDDVIVQLKPQITFHPTAGIFLAPIRLLRTIMQYNPILWQEDPLLNDISSRTRDLEARELLTLSWKELLATIKEAQETFVDVGDLRRRYYPRMGFAAGMLLLNLVLLGRSNRFGILLSGVQNKTMEANRELETLAKLIRDDPMLAQVFSKHGADDLWKALEEEPSGRVHELNEKIKQLDREISGMKTRKNEMESMRTEQKRTLAELEIYKKQHSQKTNDIKALEDRLKEIKKEKEKASEKRTEEISEYEERRITVEREIAITTNSSENIQKELKVLEPVAAEIDEIEKKLTSTKNKIDALSKEIEEREKGIIRIFNPEIKNIYAKMGFEKVNELHLDDNFNLKVVRLSKAGAGYSDTVKSLSKTEREVAGLILLISGYRAFKIGEKYPFFIIDEISFMDMQRLKIFINHVKETARSVVIMTIPGREVGLPGVTHIPLSMSTSPP